MTTTVVGSGGAGLGDTQESVENPKAVGIRPIGTERVDVGIAHLGRRRR